MLPVPESAGRFAANTLGCVVLPSISILGLKGTWLEEGEGDVTGILM